MRLSIAVTLKTRLASVKSRASSSRLCSFRCRARKRCSIAEDGVWSTLTLSLKEPTQPSQAPAVSGSKWATMRSVRGLSRAL